MDGVLYSWIKDIFATDPFNSSALFSIGTGTFVCFSKQVVCQLHLLWKYSEHRLKKNPWSEQSENHKTVFKETKVFLTERKQM